ncbi:hypothetical protein [Streptomyces sp. NPDC056304]
MAAAVVDIGNCSGADVDKLKEFGLTAMSNCQILCIDGCGRTFQVGRWS